MLVKRLITTEGSLLIPGFKDIKFSTLKIDPINHFLWKSSKKVGTTAKTNQLKNFRTQFLK
jgi:hypothetical protein